MNREVRWRPVRSQAVCWREWDDEFVLYNDDTGSTHHLNALGGEVVLTLLQHPEGIATGDLMRDVEMRFEAAAGVALSAEIERTLAQLATLEIATSSES